MANLRNSDWLLINDLVYSIYTIDNEAAMRKHFLEIIRFLIPYSSATFYLADMNLDNPLIKLVNVDLPEEKRLSYDDYYYKLDYTRKFNNISNSVVYRETDLFDERESTEYFNEYLQPDMYFTISVFLASQEGLQGRINLYRYQHDDDFADQDLFILRLLTRHIENCLLQIKQNTLRGDREPTSITYLTDKCKLTKREAEVIDLVLQGLSNCDISERLSIGLGTVKRHMSSIFDKTGMNNRSKLISNLIKFR